MSTNQPPAPEGRDEAYSSLSSIDPALDFIEVSGPDGMVPVADVLEVLNSEAILATTAKTSATFFFHAHVGLWCVDGEVFDRHLLTALVKSARRSEGKKHEIKGANQ